MQFCWKTTMKILEDLELIYLGSNKINKHPILNDFVISLKVYDPVLDTYAVMDLGYVNTFEQYYIIQYRPVSEYQLRRQLW